MNYRSLETLYQRGLNQSAQVVAAGSIILGALNSHAYADLGFARVDTQSFLLHSGDRSDSATSFVFGPDVESKGGKIAAKLELEAYTFLNDPRATFTIESQNAYLATSPDISSLHQVTVGRRMFDWSASDDVWKFGLWTPRFNWDPLLPEQVGNTGVFYSYQSDAWRFLAFGSGVAVPERGSPLNGNLTSDNPMYNNPVSGANLPPFNNAHLPINYSVQYPPTSDLIFLPSAAFQAKYGEKWGNWGSVGYGYMPIHQPILGIEGSIPAQAQQLNVNVHPLVFMQHVLTIETGYKEKHFSAWVSASREIPVMQDEPSNWQFVPMGPATLTSGGMSWEAFRNFTIGSSVMWINETLPAPIPDSIPLTLLGRFPYTEATELSFDWQAAPAWNYRALWIDDISNVSNLVSLDLDYKPLAHQNWLLGVGADIISSATGLGLIGQFQGNDRIRVRVAYAF